MNAREELAALKAEAEASCTHRVRAIALADEEVDTKQLLLEAGYHAGRAATLEELIREEEACRA